LLVSLAVLLLAGTDPAPTPDASATPAASGQAQAAAEAPAKPKKKKKAARVCHDETPTGSNIVTQRCVSAEQAEDERRGAERFQQRSADADLKTLR
jgi:hypothetical protein